MYIIPSIVIQPVYPCVYLSKYTKHDVYNVHIIKLCLQTATATEDLGNIKQKY